MHPRHHVCQTVRRGPLKRPLTKEKMQAMLLLDCSKERAGQLNPLLMADHETSSKDSGSEFSRRGSHDGPTPRLDRPIAQAGDL